MLDYKQMICSLLSKMGAPVCGNDPMCDQSADLSDQYLAFMYLAHNDATQV